MKVYIESHGLNTEEVKAAIEQARRWKQEYSEMKWEDVRKRLLLDIIKVISMEELGFVTEILKYIKEHHPELLKDI